MSKAHLLDKAIAADPSLRTKWEEAVQTLGKSEIEKADLIRKRGSGRYVSPQIQSGWEGFVSGYLLALECIKRESDRVEEGLAALSSLACGDSLVMDDRRLALIVNRPDGLTPSGLPNTVLRIQWWHGGEDPLRGGQRWHLEIAVKAGASVIKSRT